MTHDQQRRVTICCCDCFEPVDEIGHPTCDCEDSRHHRKSRAVAMVMGGFFVAVAFVAIAMVCGGVVR